MTRFLESADLALAQIALSTAILLWNIVLAGRISRWRNIPPFMAAVSAVAGLLIAPAVFIQIASGSVLTGRALFAVAWVWPATCVLIAVQATYAVVRGYSAPAIGIPIAAYDVLLATTYALRYALAHGANLPISLLAFPAAHAASFGLLGVPLLQLASYHLHLPVLTPISPGRRGVGTPVRSAVAAVCGVSIALILVRLPASARAVASYESHDADELRDRSDSGFAVGLKVMPTLTGAPPPLSIASDLALADSLDLQAISIYVAPAITNAALDSLARSIDELRATLRVIVALDMRGSRLPERASLPRWLRGRLDDVQRIASHVRPDYLVPVIDPFAGARRALGPISSAGWRSYLEAAAAAARRGFPEVSVIAHVGGATPADSALFAWAASAASPLDGAGVSIAPSYDGAPAIDARMDAVDRWLLAVPPQKELWVLEAAGAPLAHGERNQARAIWAAITWASGRRAIRGVVVLEASDYDAPVGLRGAGGHLRGAVEQLQRGARSSREGSPR
ncbi:MAG: hypothetical protein M3068_08315 [Gemmatimonadota bacterium]|nr:hypothetical protein [Gemmatimonadota bacterium]